MTVVNERLESAQPEHLRIGDVQILESEFTQDRKGHEYLYRRVHVEDESDINPYLRDKYRELGNQFEQKLRLQPQWGSTVIKNGEVFVAEDNEAAQWLYYNVDGSRSQLFDWAAKFPSAIALEPLQLLEKGGAWLPPEKGSTQGGPSERSTELYTYMIDGIGLRNRARIYGQQLVSYAEQANTSEINIISLGSGAAIPNVQATEKLEAIGKAAHWNFFDYDPKALMYAQKFSQESNFKYSTFNFGPERENPETRKIEPTGRFYQRAFEVQDESVDIVDALGLWEYLNPLQAVDFAGKLYEKIKPGGSMIVSNMLPSRPQRELNQRAVGWPGLYLRNDTDLLDIVKEAGIDTKKVTITHSDDGGYRDGVYAVMEIKKP